MLADLRKRWSFSTYSTIPQSIGIQWYTVYVSICSVSLVVDLKCEPGAYEPSLQASFASVQRIHTMTSSSTSLRQVGRRDHTSSK